MNGQMTFENIYQTYSERILNLVFRMTSNEEVARDLTQEIFIRVYRNLETFRQESQLYTWIHTIAVHHVLNYLKREKRLRWIPIMNPEQPELSIPGNLPRQEAGHEGPEPADTVFEQKERTAIVLKALQTLAPKYRIPLILHHYEGISYRDISEILKISTSAVETRIHRAKKQLIRKLEPLVNQI